MAPWPALSPDNCSLRQVRFVLVFYFPRHTHVSAQQRLVDCSLSVSRSPDRIGPFTPSFRCCPPDIPSVLADRDEFFELPAPRGGGAPIQGFGHCPAGSFLPINSGRRYRFVPKGR